MNKFIKTLLASLLLFSFAACNKEDDLEVIFTDHSWRLAYIQEGTEKTTPQGSDYTIIFKENTFALTTPADAKITGRWQADGDSRELKCNDIKISGSIEEDQIAGHIARLLPNIVSYDGDTNWLQMIVQKGNVFMQFYNR